MKLVDDLDQGSEAWHAWRQTGIGGSDARAVAGVDPWVTPYELWQRKLNLIEGTFFNNAMRKGVELEPIARAEAEWDLGMTFTPMCAVHDDFPFIKASFDGLCLPDCKDMIEVKCPGDKTHQEALDGRVPDYYMVQLWHQFLVNEKGERNHYYSFNEKTGGVVITVERNEKQIKRLLDMELKFWELIQSENPPPLTDRDYIPRLDTEWRETAEKWLRWKSWFDSADQQLKLVRAQLIKLAHEHSSVGAGVRVAVFPRRGQTDKDAIIDKLTEEISERDSKIKELVDILGEPFPVPDPVSINRDEYRKPSSMVTEITEAKGD